MVREKIKPLVCATLVFCTLAGCSDFDQSDPATRAESSKTFSEADRVAARALSISNNELTAAAKSPYDNALLCRNGLQSIGPRVRSSGLLSNDQVKALNAASAYFERQVMTLGKKAGKSDDEIAADLKKVAADNADLSLNARIVMGCIERLQSNIEVGDGSNDPKRSNDGRAPRI